MLAPMRFDPQTRRLSLDPRDPAFFGDPYSAYARLHASPGPVFWQDYGFWCFAGHAEVAALLRDRRFGRQILHVATRDELGWPPRPVHLADFDALERHSLLELEPPEHTRLRGLVNRAFVSRQVERLAPAIAAIAERLIDRLAPGDDLIAGLATPLPVAIIAALIGAPAGDAERLLHWSHRMVAMYQFAPTRADEVAAAAAARDFAAYVRALAGERRRAPRDDLIFWSTMSAPTADSGKRILTATLARRQETTPRVHKFVRGRSVARIEGGQPAGRRKDYSPTNVARARRHQPERLGREGSSTSPGAAAPPSDSDSASAETFAGTSLCSRARGASGS